MIHRPSASPGPSNAPTDTAHPPTYTTRGTPPERGTHGDVPPWTTAQNHKEANRLLADEFTADELNMIPILPPGTRLVGGAGYVDLRDPARREFEAGDDMVTDDRQLIVPKQPVFYEVWNRLTRKGTGT